MRKIPSFVLILLVALQSLLVLPVAPTTPAHAQSVGNYYTPITIIERSGHDLYNYSVKIVLNSTNWSGWRLLAADNGNDIYFLDSSGRPLYFWIEYFDKTEEYAVIWVRIPYIPASSNVTIYMYFGGGNPYAGYRDPSKVFLFFDDFDTLDWRVVRVGGNGKVVVEDGYLKMSSTDRGTIVDHPFKVANNMIIEAKVYVVSNAEAFDLKFSDGTYDEYTMPINGYRGVWAGWAFSTERQRIQGARDGSLILDVSTSRGLPESGKIYIFGFSWYGNVLRMWNNYSIILEGVDSGYTFTSLDYIAIGVWEGGEYWVDWVRVRYYVDPEPSVVLGSIELGTYGGLYYTPLTIVERSGSDLYNYSVRIVLNSTNWSGWDKIVTTSCSDIYFVDDTGKPLYYWIEYCNVTEKKAVIWVRVPDIPASGTTRIYMYFGGSNPYLDYMDVDQVFYVYDNFTENDIGSRWYVWRGSGTPQSWSEYIDVSNSRLVLSLRGTSYGTWYKHGVYTVAKYNAYAPYILVEIYAYDDSSNTYGDVMVGNITVNNGSSTIIAYNAIDVRIKEYGGDLWRAAVYDSSGSEAASQTINLGNPGWALHRIIFGSDKAEWYVNGQLVATLTYTGVVLPRKPVILIYQNQDEYNVVLYVYVDWIIARPYTDPEPSVSVGGVLFAHNVVLPKSTLYLVHSIVYSPSSTQLTYSFTAANTTTAGYETNYADVWGWGVYANPYEVNGTYYENTASLVAEVNISLPYTEVVVRNVTLLARTNGTGSYRQLLIRVLDSNGNVVAEYNASLGTDWSEVVVPVNASLAGQLTLWINATVVSSTSSGDEIDVRDVRIYVEHSDNPIFSVAWIPNYDYFNASTSYSVELGSEDYLNQSTIVLKLIEYLNLTNVDYPVQPVYVGVETIGGHSYNVYRIDNAVYNQVLEIHAVIENRLKRMRIHVNGFETKTVLVGENVSIDMPGPGNITIPELDKTFINVSSLTIVFTAPGIYTIVANETLTGQWMLGYVVRKITVKYGSFAIEPLDAGGMPANYTVFDYIVAGPLKKTLQGNSLVLNGLPAGKYSIIALYNGVRICSAFFNLNITTNASVVKMYCGVVRIRDYKGFERIVLASEGSRILNITSLSKRFPYSVAEIVVKGSGPFTLQIVYPSKPSKVLVTGNVSSLNYWWDGNTLVVQGVLGSTGVLNIADMYRLRVELYDRLGNMLPVKTEILVNGSRVLGPRVERFVVPGIYLVSIPESADGFKFYKFFDNTSEVSKLVIVNGTDVALKAWYRVPTTISSVKPIRVEVLSLIPLQQNTTQVYVEGFLKDYYGVGVPHRRLNITVYDPETGWFWTINVTTDASGYFKSPLIYLRPDKKYEIYIGFAGDDTYVATSTVLTITPSGLTTVYVPSTNTLAVLAGIVFAVVAATIAARRLRHIADNRQARFVYRRDK